MKRILLVEDEENLHLAIKLNLENYNVTSVYNGKNAISKFRLGRFDLIILDVMLPEINGFDICESIRLIFSTNLFSSCFCNLICSALRENNCS